MHCSGQNFVELAKQEMPEKLVLCTTGSRFTSLPDRGHYLITPAPRSAST